MNIQRVVRLPFVTAMLALGVVAAMAAELGPGSPAPKLDIKAWYRGTPIKKFDRSKIYVVEFWATWCSPCIDAMPHITELAKKNKDITFIGVSIWEDDNGSNIKQFVKKMGDKMDYNVGYSGNKTGMGTTWMQAAGLGAIPSTFIIKNNVIQWIGHPLSMEEPLKKIKAGTFDMKAPKASDPKMDAYGKCLDEAKTLIRTGNIAGAKAKISEAKNMYPGQGSTFCSMSSLLC